MCAAYGGSIVGVRGQPPPTCQEKINMVAVVVRVHDGVVESVDVYGDLLLARAAVAFQAVELQIGFTGRFDSEDVEDQTSVYEFGSYTWHVECGPVCDSVF